MIILLFITDLCKAPLDGFSAGLVDESNVFEWNVTIIGPPYSLYDGGFFNAIMSFPPDYPQNPPKMKFTSEIWHPNVGYEDSGERWLPIHTVESISLSIISMLSSPNIESPANIDAAIEWRDKRGEFKKKVARCIRKSQEM
ncbi:Ubiquitin-conjugating enzyme E2 7 [Lathyrus oleraceus]|uniref:Ubiquitin-conjugating enzyme E2 7 n=1 Tax=Pisum sativum TaxID=3888 RepID=A0A9D4WJB6_PEA|nr:Ubiquitin-conjugating enzyme E2 7 [Pisum sativum]